MSTYPISHPVDVHNEPRTALSAGDYTVAWLCALSLELTAAIALLDERHQPPPLNDDERSYIFGRIGNINVVLTSLSAGFDGTNAAAATATHLARTFKSLRFGLLVGIGGGIPSAANDIRLGDVVVGVPTGQYQGVVEYDHIKHKPNEVREQKGALDAPPQILLSALATLRSDHDASGETHKLEEYLPQVSRTPGYACPGFSGDHLYEAAYVHELGLPTCASCDDARIQPRNPVVRNHINVHYGTIASGNRVMKDGIERERLAQQYPGILCFEMEAAGAMTGDLRYLVIRGISDYSDSHKNDKWHGFAAATSSAFAKCLLSSLPPSTINQTTPVDMFSLESAIALELFNSLTFPDIDRRWHLIDNAEQGTCKWIFSHPEYVNWEEEGRKFIWIKGKPGSGKSTLMKRLSEVQMNKCQTTGACVAKFFINGRGDTMEYTMHGLLRALLYQTLRQHKDLLKHTIQYFQDKMKKQGKRIKWEDNELKDLLAWGSSCGPKTLWIIDAMDEFKGEQLRTAVRFFEDIVKNPRGIVRLCLASRHYPDIRVTDCAEIQMESGNGEDIRLYVESKLAQERSSYHISAKDTEDLISQIITRAQSMFLWARIALERLLSDIDDGESFRKISSTLAQFPQALESIYHDLIKGIITKGVLQEAIWLFRWILYSARPMTVTEIRQAFSWKHDDDGISNDHQMSRWIKSRSHGLIEVKSLEQTMNGESDASGGAQGTESLIVQFSHQSVKDYFSKVEALQQINASFSVLTPMESANVLMHDCIDYVKAWTCPSRDTIEDASFNGKGDCNEDCCFYTDDDDPFDPEDVLPTLRIYHICDEHHNILFTPCRFLEYASSFWLYHAREAERGGTKLASLSRRFGIGCNEETLYQRLRCLYDICCSSSQFAGGEPLGPHCPFIAAATLHDLRSAVETSLLLGEGLSVESFPEQIPTNTDGLYVEYVNHWSLMGIAAARGYLRMVQLLLEHNVPVRPVPCQNIHKHNIEICLAQSPIVEAVRSADIEIVRLIVEGHARSDGMRHSPGHRQLLQEALTESIIENDPEMVRFVIAQGANIEASQGGLSILDFAMENSSFAILEVLLASEALPSLTTLDIAIACGRYGVMPLLRRYGITINSRDHQGRTAFLRLLARSKDISRADLLIQDFIRQYRPDVKEFDEGKRTTLHFIAAAGMADSFQLAVELGADISEKDGNGSTVIHYAATTDDAIYTDKLIDSIINNGIDVNERDANGNTALHIAASLGRKNVVRHLARRGAELNPPNKTGFTPVNLADARLRQFGSEMESMEIQIHDGFWSHTVYRGNVMIAISNIIELDAFRNRPRAENLALLASDVQDAPETHKRKRSPGSMALQQSDMQNVIGKHRGKRRRTERREGELDDGCYAKSQSI